jgi:hypothetical protein
MVRVVTLAAERMVPQPQPRSFAQLASGDAGGGGARHWLSRPSFVGGKLRQQFRCALVDRFRQASVVGNFGDDLPFVFQEAVSVACGCLVFAVGGYFSASARGRDLLCASAQSRPLHDRESLSSIVFVIVLTIVAFCRSLFLLSFFLEE